MRYRTICMVAAVCALLLAAGATKMMAQQGQVPGRLDLDSIYLTTYWLPYDTNAINAQLQTETNPERKYALLVMKVARYASFGEYQLVEPFAKLALRFLPTKNEIHHAAAILYFYATGEAGKGNLPNAAQAFQACDSMAQISGSYMLMCRTKQALGELSRRQAQYEMALMRIQESEAVARAHHLPDEIMEAKCRYLSIYLQSNDAATDTSYLGKATQLIDSIFAQPTLKPYVAAYVQAEAGMIALKREQYTKATAYFEKSKQVFGELGETQNYCNQQVNLFLVLAQSDQVDAALRTGPKVLADNAKNGFTSRDHEVYKYMVLFSEQRGDYKTAFHYQRLRTEANAQQFKIETSNALTEFEERYKAKEKENALKLAQREKVYFQVESEGNAEQIRVWRWVVAGIALLLLTVAALAIRTVVANRRIRQLLAQVQEQNAIISKNLEEKNILFKELHHRVKNNLQLLMSFMNLHYAHHRDQPVKEFIATIEKKIRAMALVHEQLHQDNEVGRVMLKQYFQDIAESLLGGYGAATQDFELHIEGAELDLPIEEAIPMGLIVNEIVTNSIKYAFGKATKPPTISLEMRTEGGHKTIRISDNGVGFPSDFDPLKTKRIGSKVIVLLARQINATVAYFNQEGAVWKFQLSS